MTAKNQPQEKNVILGAFLDGFLADQMECAESDIESTKAALLAVYRDANIFRKLDANSASK